MKVTLHADEAGDGYVIINFDSPVYVTAAAAHTSLVLNDAEYEALRAAIAEYEARTCKMAERLGGAG